MDKALRDGGVDPAEVNRRGYVTEEEVAMLMGQQEARAAEEARLADQKASTSFLLPPAT
jgi:hypothetical protein